MAFSLSVSMDDGLRAAAMGPREWRLQVTPTPVIAISNPSSPSRSGGASAHDPAPRVARSTSATSIAAEHKLDLSTHSRPSIIRPQKREYLLTGTATFTKVPGSRLRAMWQSPKTRMGCANAEKSAIIRSQTHGLTPCRFAAGEILSTISLSRPMWMRVRMQNKY